MHLLAVHLLYIRKNEAEDPWIIRAQNAKY